MRALRGLILLPANALLSGCNMVVLNPAGDVARQQRDILLASTGLMLLIILPVMIATALFAWRYRQSNTKAAYDPEWHHSTQLEVAIWSAPLAIIVALGALAWTGTHLLDPYRPISEVARGRPVPAGVQPLVVDAVALDWKWLFIYPQYGIAAVNELAAPLDTPIDFQITSSSMMNSFFIPALAGQIYAMPGMETKLHAVADQTGDYTGFSANYSGRGFSDMNFTFHSMTDANFQHWVEAIKTGTGDLDRQTYLALAKPSEANPVAHYAAVDPDLYNAIANECVEPGKMCMSDMMRIDASGGRKDAGSTSMQSMTSNEHGRKEGEVGPNAPQAPPSRQKPVSP